MVLATDPVSVVSVFSSFKVPHRLAILAEGESLFNDATALIIFMFIAIPMMNGVEIGAMDIAIVSLKVISVSVFIGLVIGREDTKTDGKGYRNNCQKEKTNGIFLQIF